MRRPEGNPRLLVAALAALAALSAVALTAVPAGGQGADGPRLTVHRLIRPSSIEDFIEHGEVARVSCDANCTVTMRLRTSRRVARALGHPNKRVIAQRSKPFAAGFRGWLAARPRGIVRKRLRQGVVDGGFSFKIHLEATLRVG